MASLETPATSGDPTSPVPLDTIPISPAGDKASSGSEYPTGKAARNLDEPREQITVFHDADHFNVKHPLMHEWTLWFTKPPSGNV